MQVSFPQKNNFDTLTANHLLCPDIDTPSDGLSISSNGVQYISMAGNILNSYKETKLRIGVRLSDQLGNTLLDPDDAGAITTLADVVSATTFNGVTVRERYLEGVANKEFVPCIYIGELTNKGVEFDGSGYEQQNIDADDVDPYYLLALPTNLYGKKLYVKDVHVEVTGANATNLIDHMYVKGVVYGGPANLQSEPAVLDGIEDKVYSLTAADASGYTYVAIKLSWIVADAGILQIRGVAIECYYDT